MPDNSTNVNSTTSAISIELSERLEAINEAIPAIYSALIDAANQLDKYELQYKTTDKFSNLNVTDAEKNSFLAKVIAQQADIASKVIYAKYTHILSIDHSGMRSQSPTLEWFTPSGIKNQINKIRSAKNADNEGLTDPRNLLETIGNNVDIQWLIPGIIPQGDLMFLAGNAKAGKTLLGLFLCDAVSAEGVFLDYFPCRMGRSLVIQVDESLVSTAIKAKMLGLDDDAKQERLMSKSNGIDIVRSFNLMTDTANLESWLEKAEESGYPYKLVVLDNLIATMESSGLDMKQPNYAYPLRKLQDIAIKFNVAIIVLAHLNKTGDVLGSNYIKGIGAGTFKLTAENNNGDDEDNEDENSTRRLILEASTRNSSAFKMLISSSVHTDTGIITYSLQAYNGVKKADLTLLWKIIRLLLQNKTWVTKEALLDLFPELSSNNGLYVKLLRLGIQMTLIQAHTDAKSKITSYRITPSAQTLFEAVPRFQQYLQVFDLLNQLTATEVLVEQGKIIAALRAMDIEKEILTLMTPEERIVLSQLNKIADRKRSKHKEASINTEATAPTVTEENSVENTVAIEELTTTVKSPIIETEEPKVNEETTDEEVNTIVPDESIEPVKSTAPKYEFEQYLRK